MGMHSPIRVEPRGYDASEGTDRMSGPKILLVIGGGIAAYKSCELVRLIRKAGGSVTCVLTEGGQQFVTPMALAALSENKVYTSLFDLKDEVEMGHIQLSREADLVVVCPATADLLAKMAAGIADDLATTLILATDKPVLTVPAMNVKMWEHQATQRNADWLRQAGVAVMDPDEGPMACGEFGPGRMPEPPSILARIAEELDLDIEVPELTALKPAQLAAPEPSDEPEEVEGDLHEALEPEDEEEVAKSGGGLGGLLSMIIPRSTAQRSHDEIEAELDELPEPDMLGAEDLPDEPEPAGDAGPILATKGKASSAPPTDPEAINHEVARQDMRAMPQPVFDEVRTADITFDESPLAGQAEFDPNPDHRPLYGKHVLITAGPTHEPIDPVRYIANRSSGKQGFSIAAAAAAAGARVTLVAGPVTLATPPGVTRVDVQTARDMAEAVRESLPADVAVMTAAVADWRAADTRSQKMKKRSSAPPALRLEENPDILATLGTSDQRPALLIGFAAETENVVEHAKAKRERKRADWIVANDVSGPVGASVMGGADNTIHLVTANNVEDWPEMPKEEVAMKLVERIAAEMEAMNDG